MSIPISTLTGANTIAQLIYNVNRIKTLAANTASIVANSTFQSALANTNSYIATKVNTTTFNSALANTNAYIATNNSGLANTNAYIATKYSVANVEAKFVSNTYAQTILANTNSYIATKYSVANVEAKFVSNTYAQTILANTNSYIAAAQAKSDRFDGVGVETPEVEEYDLYRSAPFAHSIVAIRYGCVSGTATVELKVDATVVDTLSTNSTFATATVNQAVAVGDRVYLNVTAVSSCEGLEIHLGGA